MNTISVYFVIRELGIIGDLGIEIVAESQVFG